MPYIRLAYYSLLVFTAALMVSAIANAQPAVVTAHNLNAIVDVDVCEAGGIDMCMETGSNVAAAAGNTSVVAVVVQVALNNAAPLAGLAESAFSLNSVTNRAPAADPIFVGTGGGCADCFVEAQPGVYRLAIQPAFNGIWGAGTYVTLLRVTSGNVTREIVIPIDIPN